MEYTKEISVDLSGEALFGYITATQGDANSRKVKITLLNNSQPYTVPLGASAVLRCKKPDGTTVFNNATINTDGTITADLTEQMLAAVGNCRCEVTLYGTDNSSLTTVPFIVKVTPASVSPDITSSDEFNALTEALTEVKNVSETASAALTTATAALNKMDEIEADIDEHTAAAAAATQNANTAAATAQAAAEAAAAEEQRSNNAFANALKGSVSGSAVRMDDTSPVEHTIGVKAKSKNMLNPTLWSTAETSFGVTIQYLPDEDCFLFNGTATKTDGATVGTKKLPNIPLDKGKYTVSATYVSGTVSPENRTVFYIGAKDDLTVSTSLNWMATKLSMSNTSFTADSRNYLVQYWFYWYGDITFTDYKVKLQFEENNAATPYTPFVPDLTATKVMKYGKNLFDKSLVNFSAYADSGAFHCHLVETLDTGWILQGEDNNQIGNAVYNNGWARLGYGASGATPPQGIKTIIGQTYTLSYDITLLEKTYPDSTYPFIARIAHKKGDMGSVKEYSLTVNEKKHITLSATANIETYIFPTVSLNSNKVQIENVQIELGTDATDYESFSKAEYTPAADGTVSGVKSLYPITSLIPDTEGLTLEADYNRDINKAFAELQQAIISTGGNV